MAPNPPAYAYIPGHWPHPSNDVNGHSYGVHASPACALDLASWQDCTTYMDGIWLFNEGYYWEAHEAWEAIWKLMGRHGIEEQFLKGLIKVAASGIKIRQGHGKAARSLLTQAAKHFENVETRYSEKVAGGIRLSVMERWCRDFRDEVTDISVNPAVKVEIVLPPLKLQ